MGTGRKKIEIKPIQSMTRRRVTLTKRRQGLFKEMAKLRELTGCEAFALVFSTGGKPCIFGNIDLAESVANGGENSGVGSVCCGGVEVIGESGTSYTGGSEFEFSADLDLLTADFELSADLDLLIADGNELLEPSFDQFMPLSMVVEDSMALPMCTIQELMTMQLLTVEDQMPLQAIQEHDLIWDFDEPLHLPGEVPEPLPMWGIEEPPLNFDVVDGCPLY